MDDLRDFLQQRNIPEETIETMLKEKIDTSIIQLMTDEQLKRYLPSYGDRLALLGFCRRKETVNPNGRKTKLFERLKSKLRKRRSADEDGSSTEQEEQSETCVKKNALKSKRKIELGWMVYDEEKEAFKQVRAKRGGGTRRVDVSKDAKKGDIIQMAVGLFFPNGRNREGFIADFDIDLRDYQEVAVDDKITVGQLYSDTKLPVIRFYLTTRKKMASHSNCQDEASSPFSQDHDSSPSQPSSSSAFNDATISQATISETVTTDLIFFRSSTNLDNIDLTLHSTEFMDDDLDSSNIVFVGEFSEGEPQILDDTLPLSPQSISSAEPVKKILIVHRGQVLHQLIAHFCDDKLLESNFRIQLILPDGKPEMAYDDGGVVRDCLSEFWKDFYEHCATGNAYKVPFLRHDYGQEQWESVGRIIAFGWTREKYLPVRIAPVILEQAAFGHVQSDVVENFLKYMPESDRSVFQSWQSDFSSVDQEELLEILDNHSCRRMPTASNANEILQELAHKTLVQEPAYVIEQWAKILCITENSGLASVYENLQPNVRKVLKSLVFPEEMNVHQKDIQRYVTTFIRNADLQHLSLFLRFCTGSDLFLDKRISIDFNKIQGFLRRPVAHTCGCVLELSVYYDNYPDFSAEMNNVLDSNVWVMDIV